MVIHSIWPIPWRSSVRRTWPVSSRWSRRCDWGDRSDTSSTKISTNRRGFMRTRQAKYFHFLCSAAIFLTCGIAAAAQSENKTPSPDGRSFTGEWQGMLSKLHLIFKIDLGTDGALSGKLTSVDQGNATIPVDTVSFAPATGLPLDLKSIGATYQAKLSDDGTELIGTWQQGGNSIPLSLHRPGAAASKPAFKARTVGRVPMEPCSTPDGNTAGLCGKYEVYENRASQSGRKIALNIMLLPAVSDKPASDPWFALAGGPGQSAVEAYPLAGFTTKLRQQRDVVLVDQRGTGTSNPLPCVLRDTKDAQAMIAEAIPPEKVRACRTELENKADLAQYTTTIFADDLDELRQALGYDKINV